MVETEEWSREDWRNAGCAYRWFCDQCCRYGPFDVYPMAVAKAAIEHSCNCPGAVAQR